MGQPKAGGNTFSICAVLYSRSTPPSVLRSPSCVSCVGCRGNTGRLVHHRNADSFKMFDWPATENELLDISSFISSEVISSQPTCSSGDLLPSSGRTGETYLELKPFQSQRKLPCTDIHQPRPTSRRARVEIMCRVVQWWWWVCVCPKPCTWLA